MSRNDPTDAATPVAGKTQWISYHEFVMELGMGDWLDEQQRLKGICSESGCFWPIAKWCETCRAKLCYDHLAEHGNKHARERAAQEVANAQVYAPPDSW